VVPFFMKLAHTGVLPITDKRMTRFWITLAHGVQFVMDCFERMHGGEIFVPRIPSMRVVDLAKAIAPHAKLKTIGIRPGEKLHEELISASDSRRTVDRESYYIVYPEMDWWPPERIQGTPVGDGFCYASDKNTDWLDVDRLREMIKDV